MSSNALDRDRLRQALTLAESSIGLSDPNPRVGCILGHADGRVLGSGFTQAAGGPHAEVVALREARAAGADLHGATAWVTLEPCAHHGRTPPCCDALIEAGIGRLVYAVDDPFPRVAGAGLARMRAAGVEVVAGPPDLAEAAREINIGFFSRIERGRPWVRMKVAASLDGRTALADGTSQWITGPLARADGHGWRKRAGAVVTGAGTVLDDDPRLDVRLVPTARQPLRVIVDTRLRTPPGARVLAPPGSALVFTAAAPDTARAQALRLAGADVRTLAADASGRIDLGALVSALASMDLNEVHVEAGHHLNGSLVRAGLVDELLVYVAPMLIGDGPGLAAIGPLASLADAPRWRFVDIASVGMDIRLRARPAGSETVA